MAETPYTIGVEEEFFLVDLASREMRPRAERVVAAARRELGDRVTFELHLAQVEFQTEICSTLEDVRTDITRTRKTVLAAAQANDCSLLPSGTHPFTDWLGQQITPKPRYRQLDEAMQQIAWDELVCGCHVHVCVPDPELAIAVMDRLRPWLATVRALTTNSPFWQGVDTGYASFRMLLSDRWPLTGPPPLLRSRAAYDDLVETLVRSETVTDPSKIYWDVRPSMRYSTIEFRVADVLATVDEVVMLAGLVRSLVRVTAGEVERGISAPEPPVEVLRAARWRAARYGTSQRLVDVLRGSAVPAAVLVEEMLAHVREDLHEHGEWDEVAGTARRLARDGSGSQRQRRMFAVRGDHRDVVDDLIASVAP